MDSPPPYIFELLFLLFLKPIEKFLFKSTPNVPSPLSLLFFLQKEKSLYYTQNHLDLTWNYI